MVEVRSRGERRSEKKQSFVFIAFIITIAIVFFASGFMVGRNSAQKTVVDLAAADSDRQPVAKKKIEKKTDEKKGDNLTFYESLPKGEKPPLGSGINLPVPKETDVKEPVKAAAVKEEQPKETIPDKVFESVKTAPPEVKSAPVKTVSKPKVNPETINYILQVASYPQPVEAGQLVGRLTKGGYDVYMQQADLGSKGIWYRVFVGPVKGKSKAAVVQGEIEKKFKVKPLLRQQ